MLVSKRMENSETVVVFFFLDMLGRGESSWAKLLGTGKTMKLLLYR